MVYLNKISTTYCSTVPQTIYIYIYCTVYTTMLRSNRSIEKQSNKEIHHYIASVVPLAILVRTHFIQPSMTPNRRVISPSRPCPEL